jgi:hypothetical protein
MIYTDYVGLEAKETEKERILKRKRTLLKILLHCVREHSYFVRYAMLYFPKDTGSERSAKKVSTRHKLAADGNTNAFYFSTGIEDITRIMQAEETVLYRR